MFQGSRQTKRLPDFQMHCDNCGFTFLSQFEFYLPYCETLPVFVTELCWCSVGCCLAYAKAHLTVAQFVELRTDVSEMLRRPVWEKLPASQLQHNGGSLTFDDYHALGDCSQPATMGEKHHKY